MTPTPETTIRVLLKRAAKAPADELPKIIDAINALHTLQTPSSLAASINAVEQRLMRLEEITSLSERAEPRGGVGSGSRFR